MTSAKLRHLYNDASGNPGLVAGDPHDDIVLKLIQQASDEVNFKIDMMKLRNAAAKLMGSMYTLTQLIDQHMDRVVPAEPTNTYDN